MSNEEISRREILLAIMTSSLNEGMKNSLDKERWMKAQLDYQKEITKQMWTRINAEEQERLKQKYSEFSEFY